MDETTSIPVIRSGIAYVRQVESVHTVTVIISALTQASSLVSDSTAPMFSEKERQDMLSEAEQCVQVASTYLANILHTSQVGRRVEWNSGYGTHQGSITELMNDGRFMVIPDEPNTHPMYIHPSECQIIS